MIQALKQFKNRLFTHFDIRFCLKNINYNAENSHQKRALICYLCIAALNKLNAPDHSQVGEFNVILQYFVSKGYVIDVFPHYSNKWEDLEKNYDVILGFGAFYRYAKKNNPDAKAILYLTENPPVVSEKLEKERIDYFYERTGRKIGFERTGKCFTKEDMNCSDYIIYMCEKKFMKNDNSFFLAPTGLRRNDWTPVFSQKSKSTFLWFGGSAFIHKGLDICMDVFSRHPEWTLYVAGVDKKMLRKYGLRTSTPNIHILGFVDINSKLYIDIINKTTFMILPSCSEAVPTAALTSMRHGLIPMLCKDNGFNDLGDMVILFEDYHIEFIENKITEILEKYTSEECVEWSRKLAEYADINYSLATFKKNLFQILNKIICC